MVVADGILFYILFLLPFFENMDIAEEKKCLNGHKIISLMVESF